MNTNQSHSGTHPEWMDIKAIQLYACISDRTIREWIHRPHDPLPAVQIDKKILIRRSQFDRWLESHPVQLASVIEIDAIVEEVMKDMKGAIN
jgi:Helix-turn-helix domain